MRCFRYLLAAGFVILISCGGPQPREFQVGVHTIRLVAPENWEHLDYGHRHQLRRDFARIAIVDLQRGGRDLAGASERALESLGENNRREIATRIPGSIDGRDALTIDTWDRLSHEFRKRYVFVNNRGELLVIYTMHGPLEAMETVLTELLATVSFVDSLTVDGKRQSQ